MTTTDISALLSAIDQGDDSALPILADALEEVGDGRAAGLRRAASRRPRRPREYPLAWAWYSDGWPDKDLCLVERTVLLALPGYWQSQGGGHMAVYQSRSAAYLALAEALSEGQS